MSEDTKHAPPFLRSDVGERSLTDLETGNHIVTQDLRETFARSSNAAPRDAAFEKAFVLSKVRLLESHRDLDANRRVAMAGQLRDAGLFAPEETLPPPGGVGYGSFFRSSFRTDFETGTVLATDFIAPTQPGGNVSTWLYLTATNRAAKGVEAFVLYHAQDDLRFRVFDWARDDHWQTNVGFGELGDYITTKIAHGTTYQVLSVQNQTYIKSGNTWTNNVWLQNYVHNRYDLVYSYEYTSSTAEQKEGWIGSWGPIVETFQDAYSNTNQLGFLRTFLQARGSDMQWSDWALLSSDQSDIRDDDLGFRRVFLDPNHSFAVH